MIMEPRKTLKTIRYFLLLFMFISEISGSDWNYKGNFGPDFWHKLFTECAGKKQSPINIITKDTVYDPTLTEFAIWFNPPHAQDHMVVINNGHTVKVKTIGKFYVANGGLLEVYKTAQLHFHWGLEDNQGSEHQIDSASYPMELHIVNYDHSKYRSLSEAMTQPLGLAVLGVMFTVGEEDNPALEPILEVFEEIQKPGHPKMRINALSMRVFLPKDISKYYRYNGSLTTPGCYETVIWTIFKQTNYISYKQMAKLREIFYVKEFGGHPHHQHHHHDHEKLIAETQASLLAVENQEIPPALTSADNEKTEVVHKVEDIKNPTETPKLHIEASVKSKTELPKLDPQPHPEPNPKSEIPSKTTNAEAKLGETISKDKSTVVFVAAKEDPVAPIKEETKSEEIVSKNEPAVVDAPKEDAVAPNKEEAKLEEPVISKGDSDIVVAPAKEDAVAPIEKDMEVAPEAIKLPKEISEVTSLKPQGSPTVADQPPHTITDKEESVILEMQRDASFVPERNPIGQKKHHYNHKRRHMPHHHHHKHHHLSKREAGEQGEPETKEDTDYLAEGDKKLDMFEEEISKSGLKLKTEIKKINIIDNYRPVQPLHGRIVLRSFQSFEEDEVYFSGNEVRRQHPGYVQSKSEAPGSSSAKIGLIVFITIIANVLSLA